MIVSTEHKFIFAAIPKTGTHSVRRALREHLGPHDLEQVGLFVQRQFPMPELARLQHGHLSLAQVRPFLPPGQFESFFKSAFVRNPFDRFTSCCAFRTRAHGQFERDPRRVMRHFLIEAPPHDHILFAPQHSFLTDDSGALLTDFIGRVETMQASYDAICARIAISTAPLDKVNRSTRRDYRDYYDAELIAALAKLYARDLDLFGYDFDDADAAQPAQDL